eukprot:6265133-Pyramimonas_sp.AAC.1
MGRDLWGPAFWTGFASGVWLRRGGHVALTSAGHRRWIVDGRLVANAHGPELHDFPRGRRRPEEEEEEEEEDFFFLTSTSR